MRFGFGLLIVAETAAFFALLWGVANEKKLIRREEKLLRRLRRRKSARARKRSRERALRLNRRAVYVPARPEIPSAQEKAA